MSPDQGKRAPGANPGPREPAAAVGPVPREQAAWANPAPGDRTAASDPVSLSDAEITRLIAMAVHEPFAAAWRDHGEEGWRRTRRTLERVAAAHEAALAGFESYVDAASRPGDDTDGKDAAAEYRRRVVRHVLRPLHVVLGHTALAEPLHRSLMAAADRARNAAMELPERVVAAARGDALAVSAGLGARAAVKRLWARALRPIVWRHRVHEVEISSLAGQYLERDVLPCQRRAFRDSQRARAGWLGRVERAWSEWVAAVLLPPKGRQAGESHETMNPTLARLAAARRLQDELQALRDGIAAASGREAGEDFARPTTTLAARVAIAGTFVAPAPTDAPPVFDDAGLATRWDGWAREAASRLELLVALLAMRAAADAIRLRLMDRWDESIRVIDDLLDRVETALDDGAERARRLPEDAVRLRPGLASERERTLPALTRCTAELEDVAPVTDALTRRAEEAVEDLEATCLKLPEVTVHDLPEAGDTIRRPGTDARTVPTPELAAQAFDSLRMERIRTAPAAAAEALERVRSEILELGQVASYGFQAAGAELEDGAADAATHALVLVTDGLSRASDKVEVARSVLHEGRAAARGRVKREVLDGAEHLVRRATADRLAAGYLDARTYLATEVAQDWRRLRGRAVRRGLRFFAALRALGARMRSLLSLLGIRPTVPKTADPAENTLASAAEFVRTLPVVYRRLFAFEPVTDPRFLAGRDDELDEVAACWARWEAGGPGSLVVIASPGAGVTSFLNIVPTRLAGGEPRGVRQTLRERIREEGDLAARLATCLGLGRAHTLADLARAVLKSAPGSIPRLVILESAEHLHMRAPGGGRLFQRFLAFLSQTESRVFWMVSLTSSAWQLLRTREPSFASDMQRLVLEPLGPGQLRQAITSRHLRSGLPLEYVEPRAGTAALRTRAHRIHRSDRQRELLEKDYFERLHRASLGSVRLALFHWLRSADFTTAKGKLLVRPLEPLRPPTDLLDLDRCFALKAILDHGTLTATEYCEVLRTSVTESVHTLRSLEEDHFIAPAGKAESADTSDPPVRYRLRPLMTGAVIAHLQSRNILH